MNAPLVLAVSAGAVFVIRLTKSFVGSSAGGSATNGHLLPSDAGWHADKSLITELTPVIAQLSQYVMRYFDADAGHGEPLSVADERALAERVAALAAAMQARAERRAALGALPATIQGEAAQPQALEPAQEPNPLDNGPGP